MLLSQSECSILLAPTRLLTLILYLFAVFFKINSLPLLDISNNERRYHSYQKRPYENDRELYDSHRELLPHSFVWVGAQIFDGLIHYYSDSIVENRFSKYYCVQINVSI